MPETPETPETPPVLLYGSTGTGRRVTTRDLRTAKLRGERWPMLTAYDSAIAGVLDEAGIPVLLVGDSAGDNHLGYENTLPVTMEEMLVLTRAVVRGTSRALVVADLPFGSYQTSVPEAVANAVRLLKEGGAQAVKLEGGARVLPQVEAMVSAGVPVMAHLGLTPQSVHVLGGYRVQGREAEAADRLLRDAKDLQAAGAFAVVLELVPAELAARVTASLDVPTIGIGAGAGCDAQVLVWGDLAGLTPGRPARFVKRYADLRSVLTEAAQRFAAEVRDGTYPAAEHTYH